MKLLKNITLLLLAGAVATTAVAQKKKVDQKPEGYKFTTIKANPVTPPKDQNETGTCWCFAGISFLESEAIKKGAPADIDLSEMFVVSKSYTGRAIKFVQLDKNLHFGPGADFGDVLTVVKEYGLVPNSVMPGLNYGETGHVHGELTGVLRGYVNAVADNPNRKLSTAWVRGLNSVIASYLGEIPQKFTVDGKEFTPKSYVESLNLNPDDYIAFTSFTHHPFYGKFVLEVPDNWRFTEYYNIPLDEMMEIMDYAIENGYTVGWTSDMSEKSWNEKGLATVPDVEANREAGSDEARWIGATREEQTAMLYNFNSPGKEKVITQQMRQEAFDNYENTDDHGMVIIGTATDQLGNPFFKVKNSWDVRPPYEGYYYFSRPYVEYKTMEIMVNKNAIPKAIKKKMGL